MQSTFEDMVSIQSFGCHSNPTEVLRQSIPETKAVNSLPLITSNMSSSQWILNPFCQPLMATTIGGSQPLSGSEMASLITSNFFVSNNNINQMPNISLRTSLDAALASVAANSNTNTNKDIICFKSCSLYPPKANAPMSTTRERPLGCRTVFIGGLPENITEDILREVFELICGDICVIRLSKKNFCHIRFGTEKSVDSAIALSGHRLKINDSSNSDDSANTGRLHVDYAQARDDQYEWECKQRALQRQMRHRERLEYDRFCPPSPPAIHYSDSEATQLIENLKCDQNYSQAIQVLTNWLERGECQKRNCNQFYAMIQSINNHIKRLQNERQVFENEWINSRQIYHSRIQSVLVQISSIEKVFESAMKQKAWDHFTKAQRRHIDAWFKQIKEVKSAQVDDVVNKREDDEMDLSDGENDNNILIFDSMDKNNTEMGLRDENDSLKCQIESFRNEALFVEQESRQERERLEKQIAILQQALQGMQHQLIAFSQHKRTDGEHSLTRSQMIETNERQDSSDHNICETIDSSLLISLISIYLNVHPYGTTGDDIITYLCQQSHIRHSNLLSSQFVESFLSKYPKLFTQLESDSNGKTLWSYSAFQS